MRKTSQNEHKLADFENLNVEWQNGQILDEKLKESFTTSNRTLLTNNDRQVPMTSRELTGRNGGFGAEYTHEIAPGTLNQIRPASVAMPIKVPLSRKPAS